MGDVVKKIPASEKGSVLYRNKEHTPVFYSTFNENTGVYTMYKILPDGYERLGKGQNPTKLERKFGVSA